MSTKTKIYHKTLAKNRKALRDFTVVENLEVGLVLKGSELKPIRSGKVNLAGSYAIIDFREQLILKGMHVGMYDESSYMSHEAIYNRKLLAHRKEIKKLSNKIKKGGFTLIPLEVYLKNQWVKINLALARGKKKGDLREEMKKKDTEREMDRYRKTLG